MNDNQNHLIRDGRLTSRVSNQPGGRCSIMIGGWTEEELQRMNGNTPQPVKEEKTDPTKKENTVSKENVEEEKPVEEKVEEPKKVETKAEAPAPERRPVSSNAFASGANMNACNVLTDRPTSKVSAPPGGHCSIRLW